MYTWKDILVLLVRGQLGDVSQNINKILIFLSELRQRSIGTKSYVCRSLFSSLQKIYCYLKCVQS